MARRGGRKSVGGGDGGEAKVGRPQEWEDEDEDGDEEADEVSEVDVTDEDCKPWADELQEKGSLWASMPPALLRWDTHEHGSDRWWWPDHATTILVPTPTP